MASTKWKDREVSPERTKVWTEPKPRPASVPVVYYISRNGHLEHPHFMEVPVSSPDGLCLQDVIDRLNRLRGNGMAAMYSWSSKRSYKNGFVWHDLTADDLIHPAHGQEYVLKGSELLSPIDHSQTPPLDPPNSNTDVPVRTPARWKSMDLNEYKVYKNDLTTAESSPVAAADASTQTEERRQRRRALVARDSNGPPEAETTELERDEISPPPSSSSPETLETLLGAAAAAEPVRGGADEAPADRQAVASYPSGRMRASASAVLMHLISCGSVSVKDHPDLSMSSPHQYYRRPAVLPRGVPERLGDETPVIFPAVRPEDRDYFSGSLIETKKKAAAAGEAPEFAGLKRSSSYDADKSSKLELIEKEIDGVRAKCLPRKPRAPVRKEGNPPISRSTHGSKRINDEPSQK